MFGRGEPRLKLTNEHVILVGALDERHAKPGRLCHELLSLFPQRVGTEGGYRAYSFSTVADEDSGVDGRIVHDGISLQSIIEDGHLLALPEDIAEVEVRDTSGHSVDWRVSYHAQDEGDLHETTVIVCVTSRAFMSAREAAGEIVIDTSATPDEHHQGADFVKRILTVFDSAGCRHALVDVALARDAFAGAYFDPDYQPAPLPWDRLVNLMHWNRLMGTGDHRNRVRSVYWGNYLGIRLKEKLLSAVPDFVDRFTAYQTGDTAWHSARTMPSGALYLQLHEDLMSVSQIQVVGPSDTAAEMAAWLTEEFRHAGLL